MDAKFTKPSPECEYWREAAEAAFDELGLFHLLESLSIETREKIGSSLAMSCENRSLAFYSPESPYPAEIALLKASLAAEKSKVVCKECRGTGSITSYGGTFQSTSRCSVCHGEGKRLP